MIGPWASKDAEAFAIALEGRGPRNSEVQDLVRFAEGLCEAALDPSPEFLLSLRAELMADASSVLVKTPKPVRTAHAVATPHPVRRRIAAATAALLATVGMVGIVSSSAQALPGEMLYPVKRSVESVQLQLHRGEADRGAFELSLASERLTEAQSLAKNDDPRAEELVNKSLSEFADKAESGSQALFSDYQDASNDESIDKVNSFATEASTVLAKLSDVLTPGSTDAYQAAAAVVTDLASQASDMCGTCEDAELSSLARTVDRIAQALTGSKDKPAAVIKAEKDVTKVVAPPPDTTESPLTPPPTTAVPLPTPTETAEGLAGVTDPLIGALLGDDDQVGLVPGLLNGLLGRS